MSDLVPPRAQTTAPHLAPLRAAPRAGLAQTPPLPQAAWLIAWRDMRDLVGDWRTWSRDLAHRRLPPAHGGHVVAGPPLPHARLPRLLVQLARALRADAGRLLPRVLFADRAGELRGREGAQHAGGAALDAAERSRALPGQAPGLAHSAAAGELRQHGALPAGAVAATGYRPDAGILGALALVNLGQALG